ncbi:hypothetical protein Sste5346_004965 [Sporothrix stenoceras]|uniref:ASST-domain-containing protein n=1 Tax=Sporothrix stenoceras TaxID=5173 RepID=A0ABR3Z5F6_9PEZI
MIQSRYALAMVVLLGGGLGTIGVDGQVLWPLQTYKSSPATMPFLNVTKQGQTEQGFLFFSPVDIIRGAGYPAIYSDDGQLVWQGQNQTTFAMQPQIFDGEPAVTYWNGTVGFGFGFGQITIIDNTYQSIYNVTLSCKEHNFVTVFDPEPLASCIDVHESQLTDNGTLLVTAVNITQADLSSVGGPVDGWVQDGLVYEIDVKTNKVLFRWSAAEHLAEVPISYAIAPLGSEGAGSGNKTDPYGYAHLNSIAKYGENYLLSSRFMCSVFLLAPNGSVIWHLHGRTGGDFHLDLGTSFCYQHDVRIIAATPERVTISMHNNDNTEFTGATYVTTGLILDLAMQGNKTVSLAGRVWDAAEPVYVQSQGSYQSLSNGHVLMGHGAVPKIEEFDANGAIVMRARFGYDNTMQSYRAYRYPWVGHPSTVPDVAACLSAATGDTTVYISWNGATDVVSWNVPVRRRIDGR